MTAQAEADWQMIMAAFSVLDKIMVERAWSAADIDHEFMRRAIERVWTDEDREQFRAKVLAAASAEVDRMFADMGDP